FRGRRLGQREKTRAAHRSQPLDTVDVAADPEAAITQERAVAVEYRQSRELDLKPFVAAVDRPGDQDSAPGFVCRHGGGEPPRLIEAELGIDFPPRAPERDGGSAADDLGELVRPQCEAAARVHLPDET